ncbi:beta-ketoacyl synthase N-terminal-like domain-containing protein [Mangrovivirga sp. M17]|uniref:Beta-ketoacyl synthase N-terminal-like domain-containing protein n=1 Tax=Mangrovivirga halotolerans TaxID=2993936 RepID=A0ABT3RW52_9BACT|nr:beta-ketoacyl synthase N-terminal-like domain-containing protein [Mangrovivirga halotolerans]MCX2745390.1 beta-ketoacyl synthase N-terminal-like domain-containing protein [Mangrovivirga halotolerans]
MYTIADNILSPLGETTEANFKAILDGKTGIHLVQNQKLSTQAFQGAFIEQPFTEFDESLTRLEGMFCRSISTVLDEVDINLKRTVLVLSSTKGNIDTLENNGSGIRVKLTDLATRISDYFNFVNPPVLVSNACISGVSAILVAQKLINTGKYDNAIISGGDLLSKFTLSGFQSLKAVSDHPCKPYDSTRNGISLGEGVGTIVISNKKDQNRNNKALSYIKGGAQSNDANHISGPSRTGAGLKLAVLRALSQAKLTVDEIDYINAHGTATLFNDEMESITFNDLEMGNIPLNSLKGYFGHTLGASGTIEVIMAVRQMNSNTIIGSKGTNEIGVTGKMNVIKHTIDSKIERVLKTSSGFGGCNAAIIFSKL